MPNTECRFCGKVHGVQCPSVKAIEYFETGEVKRVEFMMPHDFYTPIGLPSGPQFSLPVIPDWRHGPSTARAIGTPAKGLAL
jgi:hypothetical protein